MLFVYCLSFDIIGGGVVREGDESPPMLSAAEVFIISITKQSYFYYLDHLIT